MYFAMTIGTKTNTFLYFFQHPIPWPFTFTCICYIKLFFSWIIMMKIKTYYIFFFTICTTTFIFYLINLFFKFRTPCITTDSCNFFMFIWVFKIILLKFKIKVKSIKKGLGGFLPLSLLVTKKGLGFFPKPICTFLLCGSGFFALSRLSRHSGRHKIIFTFDGGGAACNGCWAHHRRLGLFLPILMPSLICDKRQHFLNP